MIHALQDWTTLILLWVGTPIQLVFVGLFLTRKWTKYRFSRALMWKSTALLLYLYAWWSKTLVAGLRPIDWPMWIDVQTSVINAIVFWAIVNQLYALIRDILSGDRNTAETEMAEQIGKDIEQEEADREETP